MATTYLDQATFGPWTDLASASTADLGSIQSNSVNITGTTTITSFGTGVSLLRFVKFAGALTLTHNATSLILPTGANITTAAGDSAICLSDGSGNWKVVSYQRASGVSLGVPTSTTAGTVPYFSSTDGTQAAMGGVAWDNTNRSFTITGSTLTSNKPLFDMTQTWNSGATTFTGFKVNIANTSSTSNSLLFDWQVSNVSKVKATVNGDLTAGSLNAPTSTVTTSNSVQSVIAGGTVTASAPLIDATQTWNSGATLFSAFKINITNTASAANSLGFDLQVGGTSRFNYNVSQTAFSINNSTNLVIASADAGNLGGRETWITPTKIQIGSANKIAWSSSSTSPPNGSDDTILSRALAKVVSVEGASSTGGTFRHIATSPSQITADQNNYAPGGTSKFQRWSTDAARNITGLSLSQVDGQEHTIVNVGSNNIVLVHQSASSTAANRFLNSTGADITLSANQSAELIYDNTQSRWLVFKRN